MRITRITPIRPEPASAGVEVFPGEFAEVENDWYQDDIEDLKSRIASAELVSRDFALMRKAIGAETSLLVGLMLWGGREAFKVLAAWLPARAGRKVRIKFKDGTELEATTIKQLEQLRSKFLSDESGD